MIRPPWNTSHSPRVSDRRAHGYAVMQGEPGLGQRLGHIARQRRVGVARIQGMP
jgi:hypothetical protein